MYNRLIDRALLPSPWHLSHHSLLSRLLSHPSSSPFLISLLPSLTHPPSFLLSYVSFVPSFKPSSLSFLSSSPPSQDTRTHRVSGIEDQFEDRGVGWIRGGGSGSSRCRVDVQQRGVVEGVRHHHLPLPPFGLLGRRRHHRGHQYKGYKYRPVEGSARRPSFGRVRRGFEGVVRRLGFHFEGIRFGVCGVRIEVGEDCVCGWTRLGLGAVEVMF